VALAKAGLKLQVCDGQGQPSAMAACVQQAAGAKAAGIVTDAMAGLGAFGPNRPDVTHAAANHRFAYVPIYGDGIHGCQPPSGPPGRTV